jgi:hypothetical protein
VGCHIQAPSSSGWNDYAVEKASGILMSDVYIEALQAEILRTQKYSATHLGTVHIDETLESGVVWKGDVEVFRLDDHPTSRKCYAWKSPLGCVVIAQTAIISSPLDAVRAHSMGRDGH